MGFLNRLFKRGGDHEKWLAAHPGKESHKGEAPSVSDEDASRTRATMEREVEQDVERRRTRDTPAPGGSAAKDS
jgi:hypothetical protein